MAFDLDDSELRATRKMYGLDKEDDTFKISVPIVTNEELERIDLQIDKDLDGIVHEISKTVSKDKDIIILKRIIEKQQKEIEHQKEKRENQKKELAILNEKQKEFNKLVNTVNSYKGQFKRQQKEIEELKEDSCCMTNCVKRDKEKLFLQDKIKEILGIEEDIDNEKLLSLLQTIVDENARLEDIEDRKVQIEYNNVFNKGVKSVEDRIKAKIEEIDEVLKGQLIEKIKVYFEAQKEVLQSLLEKE